MRVPIDPTADRLGRERSQRMTMQEFVVLALTNECERHGVKLTGKS